MFLFSLKCLLNIQSQRYTTIGMNYCQLYKVIVGFILVQTQFLLVLITNVVTLLMVRDKTCFYLKNLCYALKVYKIL